MLYAHCQPVFPINGIVLVGVCASGKSTIAQLLTHFGMAGHSVAQEHSQCPTLFLRGTPRIVVVLTASLSTVRKRRRMQWTADQYHRQWNRLWIARNRAHLIVRTDPFDPDEVAQQIVLWFDVFTGLSQYWIRESIRDDRQRARMRQQVTSNGNLIPRTSFGILWETERKVSGLHGEIGSIVLPKPKN